MRFLVVTLALVLVGCAGRAHEVRTVRVEVPVLVPCKIQAVAAPPWAAVGLKKLIA